MYYKTRICALSWLITKIILRCTVSKTSKSVEKFQIWLTSDNTSVSLSVVRNVGNLDTRELIVAFP